MKRYELEDLHPDLPTARDLALDELEEKASRKDRRSGEAFNLDTDWNDEFPPPPF